MQSAVGFSGLPALVILHPTICFELVKVGLTLIRHLRERTLGNLVRDKGGELAALRHPGAHLFDQAIVGHVANGIEAAAFQRFVAHERSGNSVGCRTDH